ncbi:MAG: type IX secretion system outer membrane channel protein PorV [Cyclobacteriaceae bacterium]|nr:type IX secretion system outer membrane channel protein PorV [Cytophagales bacterium]MBX2901830.1 type IX secretion system outer membrane channel protein PorV [Cyclobacteriaceae bacterium]
MNKLSLLVFSLIVSTWCFAQNPPQGTLIGQDSTNRVITTAVPFLTITPDARAAGMGDVGAATSADVNSAYWNAAKLPFINSELGYGISGSYTPWLGKIINDMYVFYLSGFYRLGREQTVAASMKYFDLGEIQFKDVNNSDLGRFNPREFAFDISYGRLLTEELSIGGALRYIHSNLTGALTTGNIDARPGNSVAVDMGVYYTKPLTSRNATLSLGATITNLGAKISYSDANNRDFIPTNLRMGGAYTMDIDPKNSFTFALDFNKLLVPSPPRNNSTPLLSGIFGSFTDASGGFKEEIREFMTSFGVEYWYNKTLAARLGYFNEAKDKGNRKYLTAGVGLRYEKFGFDAAYLVPTNKRENALAETLRITIMLNIQGKAREKDSVTD